MNWRWNKLLSELLRFSPIPSLNMFSLGIYDHPQGFAEALIKQHIVHPNSFSWGLDPDPAFGWLQHKYAFT
jgi:hypothetical protein